MSLLTDVLTDLARQAETARHDPDAEVADALGVTADQYASWQLVTAAIEIANATGDPRLRPSDRVDAATATVAHQLARLWVLVGGLHRSATTSPITGPAVVAGRTPDLITEQFVLTDWLLTRPADGLVEPHHRGVGHG
jgi:hypothetical protein